MIRRDDSMRSFRLEKPKNPVGRPKLADSESIKKSWFMIGASLVIVFVLVVCGTGVLTSRTPLEVLTFKKAKASVVRTDDITIKRIKTIDNDEIKVKRVRVIPAKKVETRMINTNGTVTRIISVN